MLPRKAILALKPQAMLTDTGVGFFTNRGQKIQRITSKEGIIRYGVNFSQISPLPLQHMLRIGYLSRIELTRSEFTSVRADLIDFSKLITFGLFYKQFDATVFNALINSSMIEEWNRSNPKKNIGEVTKIDEEILQKFLRKNTEELKNIRKKIIKPLQEKILSDSTLKKEEREKMILLLNRYLDNTRPFFWFILIQFQTSPHLAKILLEIRKNLDVYIKRTSIADYLTFLLLELITNAETSNILCFTRNLYGSKINTKEILNDPKKRKALLMRMNNDQSELSIAWRFGSSHSNILTKEKKFELTVYQREANYQVLKKHIDKDLSKGGGISLDKFYGNNSASNIEMGLLYLGYLQNECQKVGMQFTSRIKENWEGVPVVVLTINF